MRRKAQPALDQLLLTTGTANGPGAAPPSSDASGPSAKEESSKPDMRSGASAPTPQSDDKTSSPLASAPTSDITNFPPPAQAPAPAPSSPAMKPVPTDKLVVVFNVIVDKYTPESFFSRVGNSTQTPAQIYTANFDSYLQSHVDPNAYSQIISVTLGSLSIQNRVIIPFRASSSVSQDAATSSLTTLQESLNSSTTLTAILPPDVFGSSSVDESSLIVSGEIPQSHVHYFDHFCFLQSPDLGLQQAC